MHPHTAYLVDSRRSVRGLLVRWVKRDDARSNMSEDDLLALAREVLARSNDDELNRVHSGASVMP
eukprot:7647-Eustigmatos_ZCMA.PRE.1